MTNYFDFWTVGDGANLLKLLDEVVWSENARKAIRSVMDSDETDPTKEEVVNSLRTFAESLNTFLLEVDHSPTHRMSPESKQFLVVWKNLAKKGKCDEAGGKEYFRVLKVWVKKGNPTNNLEGFILDHV